MPWEGAKAPGTFMERHFLNHLASPMDVAMLYFRLITVVGFALLGVAIAGELLGWWNELGEALGLLGAFLGVVGLGATLGYGATRGQVTEAARAISARMDAQSEQLGSKVDGVGHKVDGLGAKVDGVGARVDAQGDRLAANLDAQSLHLHEHTGLLRQQLVLLAQIRDRLP